MKKGPEDRTETNVYDQIAKAAKRAEKAMFDCAGPQDRASHVECLAADKELDKYLKYYGYHPLSEIKSALMESVYETINTRNEEALKVVNDGA